MMAHMRIEIVGSDCPVLAGVTVGIQRASEVVDQQSAAGGTLRWKAEVRVVDGPDFRGPYVQGKRGARFIYLTWLRAPDGLFRRAKLMLDPVPAELLGENAPASVRATFSLTMADGTPRCAAVRPPMVVWTAG